MLPYDPERPIPLAVPPNAPPTQQLLIMPPIFHHPEKFRADVQPMALATKKSFKFLFVGGTIGRKGSDVLLDTYLKQFTAARLNTQA